MDNALLEQIVSQVVKSLQEDNGDKNVEKSDSKCQESLTVNDYPLIAKRKELITTKTGKSIEDIKMENVMNDTITPDDIKITPEVLLYQAQIAKSVGRYQFAKNLERAAELTKVPDNRVLEIYNALRPYRSTKEELLKIADELENKYGAKINAEVVREACGVYEKRGRLKV